MSRYSRSVLPLFPGLGLLGFGCRWVLYAVGIDSKGLLAPHPLGTALPVLSLVTAVLALALTAKTEETTPNGLLPAGGCGVLAAAILIQSLFLEAAEGLQTLQLFRVFSWLTVGCTVTLAIRKAQGKKAYFWLYAIACVYFCLHQLLCYQLWSNKTQLQDYGFSLGAVLCAIVFLYGQAAQVLGVRHTRFQGAIGLFGLFCCCTALANCEFPVLYAGTAVFFLTELTGLKKRKENDHADP